MIYKWRLSNALKKRDYALFGLLAPLTAFFFVVISIILSPEFSWWSNALSDLGHSVDSAVAPLFNFGLLLSGILTMLYALVSLRNHAKCTSYILMFVGLMLQLVATFDEVYGSLHFQVSVLFFVALCFASVSYVVEKRSVLAFAALMIGLGSWILYGMDIYRSGIAVPEVISSVATSIWVMRSALRIYVSKSTK
jgi:hypothetical membrane protein